MSVDKRASRIREMFSSISARYDFLNHLLSLNADRYWRWRTTRLVPAGPDGPVLDMCTGTGDLALAYARRSCRTVPVLGADFSHEMLLLGQHKASRVGSLKFVEADAQRLPFPDDCFQIVCVAFGLRNVTDTARGLAEMVRVARPGGQVAILEFSIPRNRLFRAGYMAYFRYVLPLIGQTLARNRSGAYNYLPASVLEFPDGQAMLDLLRRAGLRELQWHRLTFGIASLYVGTK